MDAKSIDRADGMEGWMKSPHTLHEHWYMVQEGVRLYVVEVPEGEAGDPDREIISAHWFWHAFGNGIDLRGRTGSRIEAKNAALEAAKKAEG